MDTKVIVLVIPMLMALVIGLKLLFFPKKTSTSTHILAAYFLEFAFALSSIILTQLPISGTFEPIVNGSALLLFSLLLAIPPTLYLYVCSLQEINHPSQQAFQQLVSYYYLAILLLIINVFAFVYLYKMPEEHHLFQLVETVMTTANALALLFVFPILSIYYVYKSYLIYRAYRKKAERLYPYSETVDLKWMQIVIGGYTIFLLLIYLAEAQASDHLPIIISVLLSVYLLYIGYGGDRQQLVFNLDDRTYTEEKGKAFIPATTEEAAIPVEKTEKVELLDAETKENLKERLLELMETEKSYLDNHLTIHQLAKQANTNTKYLSYLLNTSFEMNFVSFVNKFRIEEAKRLLKDTKYNNYTIEAIGEMAGFNSVSTFNSVFKKTMKYTPSKYRKLPI